MLCKPVVARRLLQGVRTLCCLGKDTQCRLRLEQLPLELRSNMKHAFCYMTTVDTQCCGSAAGSMT